MTTANPENFTTPVGRLVEGSLYESNDTNMDGQPLVYKTGADAGKPRVEFYFAVAFAKGPEFAQYGAMGWMATEWGQRIRAIGEAWMPDAAARKFSWKVVDGDDATPKDNPKHRKNNEKEGWPGHWVVKFSGSFAPDLYTLIGQQPGKPLAFTQPGAIGLGHFVQVNVSCKANGNQNKPGVYLNPAMVCLVAYGTPIKSSAAPDPTAAGFGAAALPAGASLTPPAGFVPPAAAGAVPGVPALPPTNAPAVPALPAAAGTAPSLPTPPGIPQPPALPAPPNPAFLQPPAGPQMTPLAQQSGFTYDALKGAGWDDAAMRRSGYLV